MKKLILILICLFVSFEVKSEQIHLTCIFNEAFKINDEENTRESVDISGDEKYFLIDTEVKFFDTPFYLLRWEEEKKIRKDYKFSQNGSVYKTSEDTTKDENYEFWGKMITVIEYDRTSSKFSQTVSNNKKKTRVVWSGNCSEREIQICENEELLVCNGISNEEDKKKEVKKKYFLCRDKKNLSSFPFQVFQKHFPEHFVDRKYKENKKRIKIDYPNLSTFDKDGYHKITFNKKKLEIEVKRKTRVYDDDLSANVEYTKSSFKGQCELSKK